MRKHLLLIMAASLLDGNSFGKSARTVFMTDKKMQIISVCTVKATLLSFPAKPTKVILGNQGLYGVEYVENDLIIATLRPGAHSNLFAYLEGRRFGFDLRSGGDGCDEIVVVRDADDKRLKVRIKDE